MNDDLEPEHDWDFQTEKMLHESKVQDISIATCITGFIVMLEIVIGLGLLDLMGVF